MGNFRLTKPGLWGNRTVRAENRSFLSLVPREKGQAFCCSPGFHSVHSIHLTKGQMQQRSGECKAAAEPEVQANLLEGGRA